MTIERLGEEQARAALPELVELLQDAVHDGASVGFLRPLAGEMAASYWREILQDLGRQTRILLVARLEDRIVGTIQLGLCTRENGLHRAEVQKLLVHTRWRRRGLAKALMTAIQEEARKAKRSLLYLDTEPDRPAEQLYERLGWSRAGTIPGYALTPEGELHGTVIFYRTL